MTALTQYLSDLTDREDGEKAGDACTACEHCELVCIELGHLIDRHMKLPCQGFNGSFTREAFTRMRGRGTPAHVSLSWRGRRSLPRQTPQTRNLVCSVEATQPPGTVKRT